MIWSHIIIFWHFQLFTKTICNKIKRGNPMLTCNGSVQIRKSSLIIRLSKRNNQLIIPRPHQFLEILKYFIFLICSITLCLKLLWWKRMLRSAWLSFISTLHTRVGDVFDFFKKIKKIRFIWFKSDFFDLNQFFWFFFFPPNQHH